jgi:hypothetical protein
MAYQLEKNGSVESILTHQLKTISEATIVLKSIQVEFVMPICHYINHIRLWQRS